MDRPKELGCPTATAMSLGGNRNSGDALFESMTRVRQLALAATFVVAGIALPASPAQASCLQETVADQIGRAEVIAYGTLTGIRMTFAPASPVVTFRPDRVLKGTLSASVEVFFGPTHGGAITSVDYAGAPPETHTLYLRSAGGSYETDACSGSHSGAPTADEERLLGRGADVAVTGADRRPLVAATAIAVLALVAIAILLRRRRSA